jgi:hypothetical protein
MGIASHALPWAIFEVVEFIRTMKIFTTICLPKCRFCADLPPRARHAFLKPHYNKPTLQMKRCYISSPICGKCKRSDSPAKAVRRDLGNFPVSQTWVEVSTSKVVPGFVSPEGRAMKTLEGEMLLNSRLESARRHRYDLKCPLWMW